MVYGLYLSADGLMAQQYRQDVLANNLANTETPGFKADRVAFAERLNESMLRGSVITPGRAGGFDASTGGLFGMPVYTDFSQGSVIPSDNRFDVAILNGGFLKVQTTDGVRYTRDGRMTLDADGVLHHIASGGLVLNDQDKPLVLNPASTDPTNIDDSGRITQGENNVGQMVLVDFEDRQQLRKIGQNLFDGELARIARADGRIQQFAYEASGVEPTKGLVEMIEATRAYELNISMISMQDETLNRAVNDVGRIG